MSRVIPKCYKGCSDMPIYNFMMFARTKDYKFMVSNLKKVSSKSIEQYIESNKEGIEKSFNDIHMEYSGLTFNVKELNRHKELSALMILETKHNAIVKIIDLYLKTRELIVLDLLNSLGVGFDNAKPVDRQLRKAKKFAIGLKNQLNIKTLNFKTKYRIKDDEIEEEALGADDVEKSLDSQALTLEGNLETGYRINIRKTSVLRWINLNEANQIKIDNFKNQ